MLPTAEKLRTSTHRSQSRRIDGRRVPGTFAGGALQGMSITAVESEATDALLGFATVTDAGYVRSFHQRIGRQWQLDALDAGVR